MEVLILCSGNIVRSALAEGFLRKILGDIGVKNVIVSSAGTLGITGQPASADAIRIAKQRGFDLKQHRSKALTDLLIRRADLIVVMERAHLRRVTEIDMSAVPRSHLLTEYEAGAEKASAFDIPDPIGGTPEVNDRCFAIIERCVVNLAFGLKHQNAI